MHYINFATQIIRKKIYTESLTKRGYSGILEIIYVAF